MASFILYVYIKYWFQSSSLSTAASSDLQILNDLSTFKRVDKIVSMAALTTLIHLTWYQAEGCIPITLFNADMNDDD